MTPPSPGARINNATRKAHKHNERATVARGEKASLELQVEIAELILKSGDILAYRIWILARYLNKLESSAGQITVARLIEFICKERKIMSEHTLKKHLRCNPQFFRFTNNGRVLWPAGIMSVCLHYNCYPGYVMSVTFAEIKKLKVFKALCAWGRYGIIDDGLNRRRGGIPKGKRKPPKEFRRINSIPVSQASRSAKTGVSARSLYNYTRLIPMNIERNALKSIRAVMDPSDMDEPAGWYRAAVPDDSAGGSHMEMRKFLPNTYKLNRRLRKRTSHRRVHRALALKNGTFGKRADKESKRMHSLSQPAGRELKCRFALVDSLNGRSIGRALSQASCRTPLYIADPERPIRDTYGRRATLWKGYQRATPDGEIYRL